MPEFRTVILNLSGYSDTLKFCLIAVVILGVVTVAYIDPDKGMWFKVAYWIGSPLIAGALFASGMGSIGGFGFASLYLIVLAAAFVRFRYDK